MKRPRAVLVGPPGAGKSTVGRALAHRWGVTFRDTDRDVEQAAGMSVADIFVTAGEEHFRSLERNAVMTALGEHEGVLALGGGAVLDGDVRAALRDHVVVHLDVGLAAAMSRLAMNRSRPLLVGNVRGQWQRLSDERRPLYQEVARLSLLTDGMSAAQVADRVAADLEAEGARDQGVVHD
jgi:shikimate kinase